MTSSKGSLLLLLGCILGSQANAQADSTISLKNFKMIVGCWEGSLTYLDYRSNKPYTMPANLFIKRLKKTRSFILANSYPKESSANSSDTITISKDGRKINDQTVRSIRNNEDGSLQIITEQEGTDGNDNKPAIFRFTYLLGQKIYSRKKEVMFKGQHEWIKRNEYSYTSAPCK